MGTLEPMCGTQREFCRRASASTPLSGSYERQEANTGGEEAEGQQAQRDRQGQKPWEALGAECGPAVSDTGRKPCYVTCPKLSTLGT